ncbi:MAG: neutral zinc metallopeptidase [Syntrophotaleaceae bacterium]
MVFKFLGVKGTLILLLCVGAYGLFTGNLANMLGILGLQPNPASVTTEPLRETAEEKELVEFVSVILADTEETWTTLFRQRGQTYQEPRLVLFRDSVKSACGMAQSAMGPFYCPSDQQVYIDLGFYDQLKNRFKAPGDFAQAYVIAHEVGHHIQTLSGISSQVHAARSRLSATEANKLSVRQELQADCLAGVWAHHANNSSAAARSRRYRRRSQRRQRHWRRHLAETVARLCKPGFLYPRQFRAKGEMVQGRPGQRRHG